MNEKRWVMCYRCLHMYDYNTAPRTKTKRLRVKEVECPKCGCKLVLS